MWQIMIGHLRHFLLDFFGHIWTQGALIHFLGSVLVDVLQYSTMKEREKDLLLQETSKDAELQALNCVLSTGWPSKRKIPEYL